MEKIYKINDNIVFVNGPVNGAIYDFNHSKLYSINTAVCEALKKRIKQKKLTESEQSSLQFLMVNNLIKQGTNFEEYIPENDIVHSFYHGWIELNYSCNLRCIHCYEGQTHINNKTEALTLEQWKSVIDQLFDCGCRKLTILGGEPTLYRHAAEIVEHACKRDFIKVMFYTNAMHINEAIADVLVKNKGKAQVRFSFYSCEEEVHDLITSRKGSYTKTLQTIDKLYSLGAEVKPMIISMYENQHTVEKTVEFCKVRWGDKPGPSIYLMKKIPNCEQIAHVTSDEKIIKMTDIARVCIDDFMINEDVFKISYYKNNCWHGKFTVSETGDFSLCALSRSAVFGNVKNKKIKDILKNESLCYHWNFSYDNVEVCKDCEFRFGCRDCRPDAMSKDGNIKAKNPYCYYNPYNGTWSS